MSKEDLQDSADNLFTELNDILDTIEQATTIRKEGMKLISTGLENLDTYFKIKNSSPALIKNVFQKISDLEERNHLAKGEIYKYASEDTTKKILDLMNLNSMSLEESIKDCNEKNAKLTSDTLEKIDAFVESLKEKRELFSQESQKIKM